MKISSCHQHQDGATLGRGWLLPMACSFSLGKPFASQASPSSVVTELTKLALLGRSIGEPRCVPIKPLFLVLCQLWGILTTWHCWKRSEFNRLVAETWRKCLCLWTIVCGMPGVSGGKDAQLLSSILLCQIQPEYLLPCTWFKSKKQCDCRTSWTSQIFSWHHWTFQVFFLPLCLQLIIMFVF